MNFRTMMQAGPARANELFARLSETSDGAVKTREKLFAELKAELELFAGLEEEHLFPILRKDAETRELVAEARKDNKELRAKLAELEALPKNDEAFPERLAELQKAFRQHARDEKKELLPAVQRALSAEQAQQVAEKIGASLAEAEQAKQDEAEERRAKARQERERAEQQAEEQAAAERARAAEARQAKQAEAEEIREKARQEREQAELLVEQRAAAERRTREATEAMARTAAMANEGVRRAAETAADGARRIGTAAVGAYTGAARTAAEDLQAAAAFPRIAVGGVAEIRAAWIEWMSKTTLAGTQMSQDMLRQVAEGQRRFAAEAMRGWMEHNARVLQVARRTAEAGMRPLGRRLEAGLDGRRNSGRDA